MMIKLQKAEKHSRIKYWNVFVALLLFFTIVALGASILSLDAGAEEEAGQAILLSINEPEGTDISIKIQNYCREYPEGFALYLGNKTYKMFTAVELGSNVRIYSDGAVLQGNGSNVLFYVGDNNEFSKTSFYNCGTAISCHNRSGLKVEGCSFDTIMESGIDMFNSRYCTVHEKNKFNNMKHSSILINGTSHDIKIDNNFFDNPYIYGGYSQEQLCGHVYVLSGDSITVSNNTIKNSGGQGILFGHNVTINLGTTNCLASGNYCEGNGQEGITVFGGEEIKSYLTYNNTVINNTCVNNRFNQMEIYGADRCLVSGNKVGEYTNNCGNFGAITIYWSDETTVDNNTILRANNNGIAIIAGSTNCLIMGNAIYDTNQYNLPEGHQGQGILLDDCAIKNPEHITIKNNLIESVIHPEYTAEKSGVYSASNRIHYNTIENNIAYGYEYSEHPYALATVE